MRSGAAPRRSSTRCAGCNSTRSAPPRASRSRAASSTCARPPAPPPSTRTPRATSAFDLPGPAHRRRPQLLAAVDDLARGVLVGLPRDRVLLVDAALGVVADAVGVELLQRGELRVAQPERAVVVLAVQRPELALDGVGGQLVAGDGARRAVDRHDRLAAQRVGQLCPPTVVATIAEVLRLVARDLRG